MNNLFSPIINLSNQLRFSSKFGLIIGMFIIPSAFLGYLLLLDIQYIVDRTERMQQGLQTIESINQLAVNIAQHRGMSIAYLKGKTGFKAKITGKRQEVRSDFKQLAQQHALVGQQFDFATQDIGKPVCRP